MTSGVIIKGVGSFYYVLNELGEVVRCRMRGSFRNKKITPAVGDQVHYIIDGPGDGTVVEILPRKSYMTRPFVANATQGVIVASLKNPDISFILLDKMIVNNKINGLKSILCFNKTDLADDSMCQYVTEHYGSCGAELFFTCGKTLLGIDQLKEILQNHISVFTGVSGAGKSTILGLLGTDKTFKTGEISEKIKRGKNTTRHSELIVLDENSFIMDTPGFSDLELLLDPNDLWHYYEEFYEHSDCRFNTCVHINEPDCAVKEAVAQNLISSLRYDNYKSIYESLKKTYKPY